jgi:orotidine-5'-phosphate decarboxylase
MKMSSHINFFEKLEARVKAIDSLLCIGLDPHISQLSAPVVQAATEFCLNIIEQTHQYAAAYKPNSAFFEAFGPEGIASLRKVTFNRIMY